MRHIVFPVLFGIILVFVSACQGAPTSTPLATRAPLATGAPLATAVPPILTHVPATPAIAATATPAPDLLYKDASQPIEARVENLLGQMTLEEKIGQMAQVENFSIAPDKVTANLIGSVLSGGASIPDNSPKGWRTLVESYEQAALKTRLGIPLIYGIDAVHGHAHVDGAVIFPHNIGLGATRDPELVEKIGRATAEQMTATGIRWDFAPVVAVPQDVRWGRTYEGYSENTELVAELGAAYIKGLQNVNGKPDLSNPATVLATAKHFLGDGGTTFGSSTTVINVPYLLDQGDTQMDEPTLRALFLPPYKAAVEAGARAVMASFSSWNGTKMHANKHLLTEVLKGELGFKGFVISDWQGIDQISPDYYTALVTAINAGVDMSMIPYNYAQFTSTLKQAVNKGDVPISRINDAVRRILTVKFELGLFEHPLPDANSLTRFASPEQQQLAREAVQKSLVLLKNDKSTLPLEKDTPLIFIAGEGANSTGYQSGGWSKEWQGVTQSLGGTSIMAAVKQAVSPATRIEYNRAGDFSQVKDETGKPLKADVGIVVVAEPPYAEGQGDRTGLALPDADVLRIRSMQEQSNRVVVILLSGRPLVVTNALPYMDALVAAWLPGTEGEGITDVLFGGAPFTGKLPYTWARSDEQLQKGLKNLQKEGCDAPLFPYGYGLSASDPSPDILECK